MKLSEIKIKTQILCESHDERSKVIEIMDCSHYKYMYPESEVESFSEYPTVWIYPDRTGWLEAVKDTTEGDGQTIPASTFIASNPFA